ncbi:sensor histidine kinase [Lentzea sp. NPDC051213]|uniref:sensor histidine kinase n=1 Tax=Lentzea sp. NPDC051213 TaxID=3364126 RepID=UPI0037BD283B
MSRFALKVAALVVVTVVTAVAATTWLTLRETTRQVEKSAEIAWQELDAVVQEVTIYGLLRGSWDGVGEILPPLAARLGERVRVVTQDGVVLADTQPGPAPRQSVPVQTRAEQRVTTESNALWALHSYQSELDTARCVQKQGVGLRIVTRSGGGIGFEPVQPMQDCSVGKAQLSTEVDRLGCGEDVACVRREFAARLAAITPPPVLVQAGVADQPQQARIAVLPILGGAGLVTVLALVASLLITRRALRPISALAASSRRLGSGDLTQRVPEKGSGDLAELTRAFNGMADSLQRSREQQHHMIADIAHELRTPLANIRGYVEGVRDGVLTADDELYRSLHEEALLQQRLVDDLQELALAEAGSLVYHRSAVDLAELLAAVRLPAGTVPLVLDAPEPVVVQADQDRLRQVVGNLVTNAARAAPSVITLRCRADGAWAVIEVVDDGTGIAAEHLPHVFDRFWRADTARGRDTGGRGLGLAIAREIITAHGGSISVASVLGTGTTFTVRLPLENAPLP